MQSLPTTPLLPINHDSMALIQQGIRALVEIQQHHTQPRHLPEVTFPLLRASLQEVYHPAQIQDVHSNLIPLPLKLALARPP